MARRKVTSEIVTSQPANRFAGLSVEHRELSATELITLDSDHAVWNLTGASPTLPNVKGALLRIRPPEGFPDAALAALKGMLLKAGALAVRVLPRRLRGAPNAEPANRFAGSTRKPREVVAEMVAKAYTDDRAALAALCDEVMREGGM